MTFASKEDDDGGEETDMTDAEDGGATGVIEENPWKENIMDDTIILTEVNT